MSSSFLSDAPLISLLGNVDVSLTIVTASVNDVWKTNIMTDSSLKTDLLFRGKSLSAIFFDEKADFLYWSDVDSFTISRARLDGTDSEIFVRFGRL